METPEQQRRPTIGSLAQTLGDAKLSFDAIDLADMLWLAQFIEPVESALETDKPDPSAGQSGPSQIDDTETPSESTNESVTIYANDAASSGSTQDQQQSSSDASSPQKGTPFAVPAAPALRTRLDLARSLRPLMRKVPSRNRFVLDEDETVTQIAETEVWMPVVKPVRERWLELDLVVEASKTTVIWERVIAELNHLVTYQGAFRLVRTWQLRSPANQIQLFPRWDEKTVTRHRLHTPRELVDPSGRRLVWLVSDCTSRLWREGLIYPVLESWSKQQSMTVVQMFPERLWTRTALRDGHIVSLGSFAPGVPNRQLDVEDLPKRLQQRNSVDLVTVPIISLEAPLLNQWARVMTGRGEVRTPGRTFDLAFIRRQIQKRQADTDRTSSSHTTATDRTAEERVALFRATASKTSRQLANLMAATPVSLPVIDLIRDAFRSEFDEEVKQSHVAEVLLSGLLRRCDTGENELCRYEFFGDRSPNQEERVRYLLLGNASVSKTVRVLDVLSASICRKLGSPIKSFEALLGDLQNQDDHELQAAALPFAHVGLDVLEQLGGQYAQLAQQFRQSTQSSSNSDSLEPHEQTWPDDAEFQVIDYDVAEYIDFPPLESITVTAPAIIALQDRFEFTTATLESNPDPEAEEQWLIQQEAGVAWGYREPLSADEAEPDTEPPTLNMIAIDGGSFTMGAPENELESRDSERPTHDVTLQPFHISQIPITQAQWRIVAGYDRINRDLDPDPSSFKGDNRPVEQVSWEDAQEFCQRLTAVTGKPYRLPTEAEWEYACRAGSTTPFSFGETITTDLANYRGTDQEDYGWSGSYGDGPKGVYREETTDVGTFPANAWGLHDMHGNVWEWCEDDWHDNYDSAPKDGSAWLDLDTNEGKDKRLRGGSWYNLPGVCRSAYRYFFSRVDRNSDIGFRVCCVPPRTGS